MKLVKEHAKTIATFFVAYLANALVSLATGGTPWPQTGQEWLQYGLTTLGAAAAAFLARNKITQKQLDKDPAVPAGTVLLEPVEQAASGTGNGDPGEFKSSWR